MRKLTISNFKAFGENPVVFGGETAEGKPMTFCVLEKMDRAKLLFMKL